MSQAALLVGGTGPTGPPIVDGLRERGYTTTLFHSGRHEVAGQEDLEHIHGDAFDGDSLRTLLAGRTFDLVLAMYGRTRIVAEVLAGFCGRFVSIGGAPVYDGYFRTTQGRDALPLPVRESSDLVPDGDLDAPYAVQTIRRTEEVVLGHSEFAATVLRYPTLYGPRVPHNWEWLVVRRILDGRKHIYLADSGLALQARLATSNAAAGVLAVVDHPETATGRVFNVADSEQFTLAGWTRRITAVLGAQLEIRGVPGAAPSPGWWMTAFGVPAVTPHSVFDTSAIERDLGYADAVSPADALREAVEWAVAHRDAVDRVMGCYFDYPAEDRFDLAWEGASALLATESAPWRAVPRPPQ